MKKPILLFLVLLSIHTMGQKQGIELIDSLKTRLISSVEDTTKVRLMGKLSFQYYRFNTDSGIYYAKRAISLAEKLRWKTGLAFSYNYLGTNYAVKGNYPDALEYFGRALTTYTEIGDKQGIAFLSNNLGNFYRMQKNFPKSIEYLNESIAVNQKLNNKLDLVKNYNNLGSVYGDLLDIPKSNEFYYKALELAREINNKEQTALLLINIADNSAKIKDYCSALEFSYEALKISKDSEATYDLAVDYGFIGEIYYKLTNDSSFDRKPCNYLSQDKMGNLLNAKKYLQLAIDLLDKVNDLSEISSNALFLSKVYEKLGDPVNALKYYKQYAANKDSVLSKDNSVRFANIEKKQEGELKDKQIEIQKLEIGKKNAQIFLQIFLFIMALLLVLLLSYFHNKRRANRVLKESEEKYRFLFENNPQPMFIYDLDTLVFLEINKAAVDHYGYSKDEFLNMTIKDIRTKEDLPVLLNHIEKIRVGHDYNQSDVWMHLKKNGDLIFVELTAQPAISKGKNARHVLVNDITDRKLAEEQLRLYGEIVEHMAEGIILTRSSDGIIVYNNKAATLMFGALDGELTGKHISALNATTEKNPVEIADEIIETLNTSGIWEGEVKNIRIEGTIFWCYTQVTSFNHPKFGDVWVGILQDITEKKKMVEDLTNAKEKAEESDRLKTAFINNMSHEIRTPLNGILGFLQLMKEEDLTDKEWEEYFNIINKSGDRLMKTINDLVEISQIQSGQMKLKIAATNIGLLTDQVFQYFQCEAVLKGIDLNVNKLEDSEHIIDSDGEKIKSILSILVENAVKFTYTGSIEFGYKCIVNEAIEFYVKDTGIGIPYDKQQVIFERFMQVDVSNTRHFEGSGLGLSIAKAYVEMLQGSIRVESELEKGSVFFFTIPYNSTHVHDELISNEEVVYKNDDKQLRLKILVVDDDVSSGHLLSVMVKKYGTEITNVATGKEAVSICRNRSDIDLILMDIKMPDMDGYEATRLIRQFNTNVVIIAQTAYALSGESEKALEAGCNDYISKPIGKSELTRLINKYLYA
ncbi:MAG: PAS domain S-box protein [Mariniphaga sp.]